MTGQLGAVGKTPTTEDPDLDNLHALLEGGGTVDLEGGATYRISSGILVNGVNLFVSSPADNPATIVIDTAANSPVLQMKGCTSWSISNINIVGTNDYRDDDGYSKLDAALSANHGIGIYNCGAGTISNVAIDSVWGDGLYVGGVWGRSEGVEVDGIAVTSCGRHGIGLTDVDGITINDFTLVKGGTAGVDFEPNAPTHAVLNVTMTNFDIDPRTVPIASGATKEVSNISIDTGTIRNGFVSWPAVHATRGDGGRSSGWVVKNITDLRSIRTAYCLTFSHIDDITVQGCTFTVGAYSSRTAGVNLGDCADQATITGNDFSLMPAPYVKTASPTVTSSGNTWSGGSD